MRIFIAFQTFVLFNKDFDFLYLFIFIFIYLFYLRNQYTKIYERKDRKHRRTGNC